MKFKNQLTLEFFAVVNYLSESPRKQKVTSTGSKVMLCHLIGGFRSILCVSLCQDSLLVIIIII